MSFRIVSSAAYGGLALVISLASTGCSTDPGASVASQTLAPGPCAYASPTQPDSPSTSASASSLESMVDARVFDYANGRYLVATLPLAEWDMRVDWNPEDEGTMLRDVLAGDPTVAVAVGPALRW